jgi:hypothetical protein
MRGIGAGQTCTILVIPEIAMLIKDCLGNAGVRVPVVASGRQPQVRGKNSPGYPSKEHNIQ